MPRCPRPPCRPTHRAPKPSGARSPSCSATSPIPPRCRIRWTSRNCASSCAPSRPPRAASSRATGASSTAIWATASSRSSATRRRMKTTPGAPRAPGWNWWPPWRACSRCPVACGCGCAWASPRARWWWAKSSARARRVKSPSSAARPTWQRACSRWPCPARWSSRPARTSCSARAFAAWTSGGRLSRVSMNRCPCGACRASARWKRCPKAWTAPFRCRRWWTARSSSRR